MIPPTITETVERDWKGDLVTVPLTRSYIPAPRSDSAAFRAEDRRYDYSRDHKGPFALALQHIRTADWAFYQSGAIVTRDATLDRF